MLFYTHITNLDVTEPYNIHILDSDTTSVAVNLNGVPVGYVKPNVGKNKSYTKLVDLGGSVLQLLIVGSRQSYSGQIEKAIFADKLAKYILASNGKYLVRNNATKKYYWDSKLRTRFFFNPFYFKSGFLWRYSLGYIPSGQDDLRIWSDEAAKNLFIDPIFLVDESDTWVGEQEVLDIEPIQLKPFDTSTTGLVSTFSIDELIALPNLHNGDKLQFNNGKETLDVLVENLETKANYAAETVINRPIGYVTIDIINPNKSVILPLILNQGELKTITTELYGNNIQFTVKRT